MQKQINKETRKKIIIVNYICCILVVLIHSSGYKYFDLSDCGKIGLLMKYIIDIFIKYLPQVSVSMFFVISGFLFFKDFSIEEPFSIKKFFEKWKSRIKTLFIPYLLWNIIWMGFIAIVSNVSWIRLHIESLGLFEYSVKNVLQGIFLYKYAGITWYLFYLILYGLLSPLFFILLKSKYGKVFILVASFIFSGINKNILIYYSPAHFNSLFFYILGAYLAIYKFEAVNKRYNRKFLMTGIWGGIIITALISFDIKNQWIIEGIRLLGVCFLWFLSEAFVNKNIYWWMEISFFIYVFHGLTQQCINKIISIILPNNGIFSAACAFINTFVGMILTILLANTIAFLLIRWAKPLWMLLTGKRILRNLENKF